MTTKNHNTAIKKLLSKESLEDIIYRTHLYPFNELGHLDFASFQRRRLESLYSGFHYDFFVMSTISLDQKGEPKEIISASLDLPSSILENYVLVSNLDDLSMTAYQNPGRAIAYTQIRSHNSWLKHAFFTKHCLKYGIFRATSIIFPTPAHRQTYVSFDYLGAVDNITWSQFDFTRLELASFPFAIASLYRTGKMDEAEFKFRLMALEGLTESQLSNLRKYINSPHQSFKLQAEKLGIGESALKESLYQIRSRVSKRSKSESLDFDIPPTGSLRPIEFYFSYLTMLGDNTKPIELVQL